MPYTPLPIGLPRVAHTANYLPILAIGFTNVAVSRSSSLALCQGISNMLELPIAAQMCCKYQQMLLKVPSGSINSEHWRVLVIPILVELQSCRYILNCNLSNTHCC